MQEIGGQSRPLNDVSSATYWKLTIGLQESTAEGLIIQTKTGPDIEAEHQ